MITPLIHRVLTREDLARLVAEIGRLDQGEARAADQAEAVQHALAEARRDYLGRDVHSPESRLQRFLGRLN